MSKDKTVLRRPKRDKPVSSAGDMERAIRKPGMETGHPHIASMFLHHGDRATAEQLCKNLKPHLAKRILDPPRSEARREKEMGRMLKAA